MFDFVGLVSSVAEGDISKAAELTRKALCKYRRGKYWIADFFRQWIG